MTIIFKHTDHVTALSSKEWANLTLDLSRPEGLPVWPEPGRDPEHSQHADCPRNQGEHSVEDQWTNPSCPEEIRRCLHGNRRGCRLSIHGRDYHLDLPYQRWSSPGLLEGWDPSRTNVSQMILQWDFRNITHIHVSVKPIRPSSYIQVTNMTLSDQKLKWGVLVTYQMALTQLWVKRNWLNESPSFI